MCIQCGNETTNPKFCSRSCSTIHNNLKNPRRTKSKVCANELCDVLILSSRNYCYDHKTAGALGLSKYNTIGELRAAASYQVNAHARNLARSWAKHNIDTSKCAICNYSNHVEVCHIIGLASFPDDTPLSETFVNNLVALCPNHHWEFDNGLLTVEEVRPRQDSNLHASITG